MPASSAFPPRQEFLEETRTAMECGTFVSLILSKPMKGSDQPPRLDARPVAVQGVPHLQWTRRTGQQEVHENFSLDESLDRVRRAVPTTYRDATLITTSEQIQFRQGKRSAQVQRRKVERQPVKPQHNREKQYLIPTGAPVPFLVRLEVMTAAGQVKAEKQKKFRQINRYLELVNDVYADLPAEGTLYVVDFGCGLSYLTFALHYLLTTVHRRDVRVLGVDRNPQVIERSQAIADELQLPGLRFHSGSIAEAAFEDQYPVHLAVSLHACDTATDDTLYWAVNRQADVILAVPCCQHELAPQLSSTQFDLLTQHGIVREQFASLATDALRSKALEAVGYATQVLEFIEMEHTPKNLLIRAIRRSIERGEDLRCRSARSQFIAFKSQLGFEHLAIERLLN